MESGTKLGHYKISTLLGKGGIATDFTVSRLFGGGTAAPRWGFNTTVVRPAGGFDDPWRDYPGGIPVPYELGSGVFTPYGVFATFASYDLSPPTVQSWNLSLQRQVGSDWLASATYLGRATTHMWVQRAVNRAVYFPGSPVDGVCTAEGYTFKTTGSKCSTRGNTDLRRRLSLERPEDGEFIGVLNEREDGGTSNYNGLLLSIQRRAAEGVNVGANYTWSHCIGPASIFNTNEDGEYLDLNDRDFDRGNCDSDRRQVFNFTAVASTPEFANPTLRTLATGWQLAGIYRRSTGSWLTVELDDDRALIGQARGGNQRPLQVLDNPYKDRDSVTDFLNPDAFSRPAVGEIGSMRPNNLEGPGTWKLDVALSRNFSLGESQNLEVRAEAFNLTNSLIRDNPDADFSNNTFGQARSSADGRIMQFMLKYVF